MFACNGRLSKRKKSHVDECVTITGSFDDIGIANAFGMIEIDSSNNNKFRWDFKYEPSKKRCLLYDCIFGFTLLKRKELGD